MTQLMDNAAVKVERPAKARLGEELPIFCERCGYSLHGATPVRCGECEILHFQCPECGSHQPINTLRPAAQRILGRLRAVWLGWAVLWRLNFFGWLLLAWVGMGVEWSYQYRYVYPAVLPSGLTSAPRSNWVPRELDYESMLAFAAFGLAFGLVGRLTLLRWRRAWMVGLVMAGLVIAAVAVGGNLRMLGRSATPFTLHFLELMLIGGAAVVLGSVLAWPIWAGLTRLFLPGHVSRPLLEWMRWDEKRVDGLAR